MIKYLFSILLFASILQAATITSQQNNYDEGQTLVFTATQMPGNANDWIGIYPVGSNNDWANVVTWKWAPQNGEYTFNSIVVGSYEVRVFFNNSFVTEATDTFSVLENQQNTTITAGKEHYDAGEEVVVTVANMAGNNNDWVAIYPAGSSNDWGNVVTWKFSNGITNGNINLGVVPAGDYEARAFFNNSFNLEASNTFSVDGVVNNTSISTSKESYTVNESIIVTLANMDGNNNDWIGIYPAGTNNDWGNVVAWSYTNGITNGNLNLGDLSVGSYEARAFFNNSFVTEATDTFTVQAINLPPTIYEDAEFGLADWEIISGDYHPQRRTANGHTFVKLPTQWINRYTNRAEYHLAMNNSSQKVLSVDIGGDGERMPHYVLGVRVSTPLGVRRLMWNSFYNHSNIPAKMRVYGSTAFMTFPSPVEQVRGFGYSDVNLWENFTVNLEDALHYFEPDNTILSVDYFLATGGNLDNIMLKSN